MQRDYDAQIKDNEGRQYFYGFDYDVMHPFMLKSFKPFFREGSVLELGCHFGKFTELLLSEFSRVTCVEASIDAVAEANKVLRGRAEIHNSTFESFEVTERYDNIIMTHVLEHLEDPISVLEKINNEWLSDDGVFLLVCPNANAPSRQIAVNMGLISHNAAVTPAEEDHGHFITYSLDTLERDVKAAGLDVVHRSGIFFKALANFQWDRLLNTDIISREYLEGCYQLGHKYPDLCSSIFLACKKGRAN